uniref:BED-type domain-containing protein n=1 Tax=Salix viminalis TaxID=40686 RepID=A0A6N2LXX5_SALVM
MAENSSSGGTSISSAPARSNDPAWAHGQVVAGAKNASICVHCNKRINGGGVTRLKYHLAVSNDEEVEEGDVANPHFGDIRSQTNRRLTMQGISTTRKRIPLFAPRTTPGSQPSIRSAMASKEIEHNARKAIATWWFDANIPFNGAKSYYYQLMIDVVTSMGPGFKGPSYHDLRGSLLKDVVHDVHEYILEIKADWKFYGCSIMADGWSNRRNVPIVNFLAYSPRGTIFLKSVDTSGLQKDKETLLEIFDEVVKEVGQENIVQFVSDNEASFKAAGKALQQRKEFTNGNDLCRPGITRFATHFLSIQCLLKFKNELRQMFTCTKWVESSHGKSRVGKEITAIVLEDKDFWPRCAHIVNVSQPLVRVLRLADSEEKPSIGYLYEAMDKAKEAIKTRLKNRISQYGPYIRAFLSNKGVTRGLLRTITRLVPDCDIQDIISGQIEEYKKAAVAWWEQFGNDTEELQKFAIRVLSQCCSATGCERNWSVFEYIHSKKRNRLEHKRLNDLVFVRYNLKIQQRNLSKTRDALDPISLDNIDLLNEWICEEPNLLDGEDISWESIKAPLSTLNLDDEETCFNEENELGGNDQLLECLVDDFPYIPPQDQDPYFYINDVEDV